MHSVLWPMLFGLYLLTTMGKTMTYKQTVALVQTAHSGTRRILIDTRRAPTFQLRTRNFRPWPVGVVISSTVKSATYKNT